MAMDPKCATAIRAAAAGRKISDERMQLIEDAISEQMRELARQSRQEARASGGPDAWLSMTREQRVSAASAKAMETVQAEAALKEARGVQQILRAAETEARVMTQKMDGRTRSQAYAADIQNTANYQHAVRDEHLSGLRDMMDAAESKDGTGILRNLGMRIFNLDNPAMTADVVREVFKNADGHTGNPAAKAAAQAWLATIESMRVRFNSAGGNVGKIGYGYLSQAHDAVKVLEAGADTWAAKVLPLVDREQYVKADGSLMNDAEVMGLLRGAHDTISTGGANKTEPGQFKGSGARANHGSEHRVLHFKDGDAWMAYMKEFGEGSLYDSMIGHVGRMAGDIGLVERYGPNPEQTHRVQLDIAQRADKKGKISDLKNARSFGNAPDAYWRLITGKAGTPENQVLGRIGQDVRNIQTAAKLGGAVISSFTDVGTIAATLNYNRLPYFDMLSNIGRRLKPGSEEADFLQAHGVIAESLTSTMNRWTGDHMTHGLSGRVASSVMKLSFMNAWTDGLRGAFSATMMQGFAKKIGKSWDDLDAWDKQLMQRKGITADDWAIISRAQPTMRGDLSYLTGDAVRAVGDGGQQAANKWMAFVSDEAQFAVINPDLATRSITTAGGMQAGTIPGEAARTFAQFKSFPIAMMSRHWRRMFDTPQGLEGAPMGFGAETAAGATVNRMLVFAGMNVSLMMLGAIVLQNKALLNGKDPFDMTEGKFWSRALTQGGGMGYLGDLLFKDPTEQRGNSVEQGVGAILGPGAGAVAGLIGDLGVVNAWELAKGKETKFGAEALRWTNSQLPYASLWQIRGAWEHLFLHNAQEALSPGYLSRMQQRAAKDWSQGYWWAPGEAVPDRAPEFGNITGN
jgi:hypothetical protein